MKKILVVLVIILCCGCTAKYEINFIDDTIQDNLTITYSRTGQSNSDIDASFSDSFYAIGRDKLYNFRNLSDDKNVIVNLNYDYKYVDYLSANVPNSCFDYFKLVEDDEKYYFLAGGAFKCGYYAYEYLDSLDVVINTNHKVIENNADEIEDEKYIWHIDKNEKNFELKFVVNKNVVVPKKKINYKAILYVFAAIVSAFALVVIIIFIRHIFVNRI